MTTVMNAATAELVRALSNMFEVTAPISSERVLHRALLGAVLCVGIFVRFWGLGEPGLHGDEETMAMATMHIVQDGRPILPSGMFYPRGLTELYLMAASVLVFGESEWSFRLPSALCGVALIVLTYIAGRRFLRPQWNLALAATVALLPELVEYSQTARMYIFMITCVAVALVCIFAWERNGRLGWLIGAVAALIVGIELHALAVTCVLLFALPGVLQGDQRKFAYGLAAASIVMAAYVVLDTWVNANYPMPPPAYAAQFAPLLKQGSGLIRNESLPFEIAMWATAAVTVFLAIHFARAVRERVASYCVIVLLLSALAAQLALYYHIAALLALAGTVIAFRYGAWVRPNRFWRYAFASAAIGLIHGTVLAAWPGSVIKLVGGLVGQPSVWPYVRVSQFSATAAVLAFAATAWGLWRLATRKRVPDYWLMVLLGVWIPVFMLGFFRWNMPPRYTSASLLPLLLCAFAFAQHVFEHAARSLRLESASKPIQVALALVLVVLASNPTTTIAAITSNRTRLPDHKGAAEFMRTQQLTPEDVVLAEDVLQQTYYLGQVDYWLISRKLSWLYVHEVDGTMRDYYTNTAVVDNGEQFSELLDRYADRRIFVIGSGENTSDGRRAMRSYGIREVLESDRFEVLFIGRDGFTRVWRAKQVPALTDARRGPVAHAPPGPRIATGTPARRVADTE